MTTTINYTLSYVIDIVLLIAFLCLFVLISRLRWAGVLLAAIAFYTTFAVFLIIFGADFVGILYFIVYLGAIMTLFLFAVMFLHVMTRPELQKNSILSRLWNEIDYGWEVLCLVTKICFFFFYGILCLVRKKPKQQSATLFIVWWFSCNELSNLWGLPSPYYLLIRFLVNVFYSGVFVYFLFWSSVFADAPRAFGEYSEYIYFYLGPVIDNLASLYVAYQLEFILVSICFWVAFLCVLILLFEKKDK